MSQFATLRGKLNAAQDLVSAVVADLGDLDAEARFDEDRFERPVYRRGTVRQALAEAEPGQALFVPHSFFQGKDVYSYAGWLARDLKDLDAEVCVTFDRHVVVRIRDEYRATRVPTIAPGRDRLDEPAPHDGLAAVFQHLGVDINNG